jgi:Brp/Blh family beta-carotene 15,15'-monooxygenase
VAPQRGFAQLEQGLARFAVEWHAGPVTASTLLPVGRPWSPGRTAALVGAGSVAVLVLASAVGLAAPSAASAGPALLVLAALLGLPHGAVDHLALGWSQGERGPAPRALLVAYALGAVLVAAAALAAPVPAVLVLLVLSAAHFAEGEVAFDELRGGPGLRLPAAALGTAVVALPLLLRPEQVRPVVAALDPALPAVLAQLRLPVLALTVALVLAGAVAGVRARAWRPTAELVLVVGAAALAPALLVFAAWFGAWHAPRHLVRLLDLQPDGSAAERVRRLALGALAPTAAALGGLGVLAASGRGLPAAVLVVLLALTVPHAAVVARLRRGPALPPEPRACQTGTSTTT